MFATSFLRFYGQGFQFRRLFGAKETLARVGTEKLQDFVDGLHVFPQFRQQLFRRCRLPVRADGLD